jgi:hypothetical protein
LPPASSPSSRIRKTPGLHGMGRAIFGIIMGGLGTAFGILALIGAAVG